MQAIESAQNLVVQQGIEVGEALTGFETANKYAVLDGQGQQVCYAAEESNFLWRQLLHSHRPFTLRVRDGAGAPVLTVESPFTFFLHRCTVADADGRRIGEIRGRFALLRRIYTICDTDGRDLYELYGPVFHPWTFEIRRNGETVGKITKKWSGLGKEMFTDADNFGIELPAEADLAERLLLLGAVFLVDFAHFERSGND